MISAKYRNLCGVGDNDQSIYSFRGSNYQNILNFERDYKDAEVVLLEENYRSTQTILNAANNIIKNNKLRKEKNLWTSNEVGDKIIYHRASNEKDEANYIVSEVNKLIDNNVDKNEIVVLYRTNAQSRNIEEAFLKSNIPYKVVGSFYFYNRKEIKDLIAYLKVIYNTKDDVNLLRIINVPKRGIGLKTIENLMDKASLNNLSIFDSIDSGKELAFKELIASLIRKSEKCTLTELIDLILDASGMLKELESEKSLESEARIENLEEFKSITKSFEERDGIISLEAFLNEISLVSDIEEHKDQKDVVTLMTVHSAKGLEFDNVFIAGFEEGIFPHYNSFDSEDELEEERRLCYVAITRARKKLWIVNTLVRLLYGNSEAHVPSRFINEIGNEYLESDKIPDKKEIKLDRFKNSGIISEKVNHDDIKVGDKINHTEFGIGVVITVDKSILTVAFKHPIGIKKLMKGHKSITKV
jgi:DNA helicase-2/ATP-dependent DNA helicase PcrA